MLYVVYIQIQTVPMKIFLPKRKKLKLFCIRADHSLMHILLMRVIGGLSGFGRCVLFLQRSIASVTHLWISLPIELMISELDWLLSILVGGGNIRPDKTRIIISITYVYPMRMRKPFISSCFCLQYTSTGRGRAEISMLPETPYILLPPSPHWN